MQWQQKFLSTLLGLGLMGIVSSEAMAIRAPSVGMANPASVNCLKRGGRLSYVSTPYGQAAYCTLPNGQKCEEWALLNNKCPKPMMIKSKLTPIKPKVSVPKPTPTKPVPFKPRVLADGYQSLPVTEVHVRQMAQFAARQLSQNKASVKTIVWAQRQHVSGQNYRMMLILTNGQRYSALVYQAPGNHPPLLREAKLIKP